MYADLLLLIEIFHMQKQPIIFSDIIEKAENFQMLTRNELITLLGYSEISHEADKIRSTANQISRKRFENKGIILGQIGYETSPCSGNCQFCAFAKDYTTQGTNTLFQEELFQQASEFLAHRSLFALFLMATHDFKFEVLLNTIAALKPILRPDVRFVVNIGDFDRSQAEELKSSGVSGAYHVLRLREGEVTDLNPEQRRQTIIALREAGIDWYYCCEPVGPEHTAEEIVDQILLGREFEAFQHAGMRRVLLPNSPLAKLGIISELRLAQVTAVVSLAMIGNERLESIAVHEPNTLGLCSGANAVYAESGANPRDLDTKTERGRGHSVCDCAQMLLECGYTSVNNGRFEKIDFPELR
jgi:biotin synthase